MQLLCGASLARLLGLGQTRRLLTVLFPNRAKLQHVRREEKICGAQADYLDLDHMDGGVRGTQRHPLRRSSILAEAKRRENPKLGIEFSFHQSHCISSTTEQDFSNHSRPSSSQGEVP